MTPESVRELLEGTDYEVRNLSPIFAEVLLANAIDHFSLRTAPGVKPYQWCRYQVDTYDLICLLNSWFKMHEELERLKCKTT